MPSGEDGDVNRQSAGKYDEKRLGYYYGCDNWNLWLLHIVVIECAQWS